eukprot:1052437-Prymnesium_polylepis.1
MITNDTMRHRRSSVDRGACGACADGTDQLQLMGMRLAMANNQGPSRNQSRRGSCTGRIAQAPLEGLMVVNARTPGATADASLGLGLVEDAGAANMRRRRSSCCSVRIHTVVVT